MYSIHDIVTCGNRNQEKEVFAGSTKFDGIIVHKGKA
jgi:hypothetical protein